MLWVLPPPKLVCNSMTGSPPPPERRRAAPASRSFNPSVRKVRAKNAIGSWYSSSAVLLATSNRSAANSAWSNRPDATSVCGEMISRHGVSPAWGSPSVGLAAFLRRWALDSSSKSCRMRSLRSVLTSWRSSGQPNASRRRSIESRALVASSVLNAS